MNAIASIDQPCCKGDCRELRRLSSRIVMLEDELYERNQALSQRTQKTAEDVRGIYEAKVTELKKRIRLLEDLHQQKVAEIKFEFKAKEEALKEKVKNQEQELRMFRDTTPGSGQSEKFSGNSLDKGGSTSRGKSRKPRTGGHGGGRKPHDELEPEEEILGLTEDERTCPQCGNIAIEINTDECAEEVELEVVVRRKRLKRQKYRGCSCGCQPAILTTPLPQKAMTRSAYSDLFWINLCLFKYDLQIPVNRFIIMMEGLGLINLSSGTLSDGLIRMGDLLAPIDQAIIEHNLKACFWQADETRLAVFEHREGRSTFNWTLWQIQGNGTVVYQLTPTREAVEIQAYFAEVTEGVILSDRAKVYQTLWFPVAFCWVHVRRDFIKLGRYTKGNRTWAIKWLRRLRTLFRLYKARAQVADDPSEFARADKKLRQNVERMRHCMEMELADTALKQKCRKVLTSLENHWDGLTLFLDNPGIPIDNNAVERLFRPVANLRKSSYGCHSEKAGHNTARMLTVIQTLKAHNIFPREWMCSWLRVGAEINSHVGRRNCNRSQGMTDDGNGLPEEGMTPNSVTSALNSMIQHCEVISKATLKAIAENNGCPPKDITPFLPWEYAKQK